MEVEAFTVDEGEVAHVDVKQNGRKLIADWISLLSVAILGCFILFHNL
jgi:hypothetical protein